MTLRRQLLGAGLGGAAVGIGCLLAGCQAADSAERTGPAARNSPPPPQRPAETGAPRSAERAPATRPPTAEAVRLPAVKVHEWPLSDFGMSVKTNFEVAQGENVKWMEISGVEAGGPAAQTGLGVGDRILAIDGTLVTTLTREGLLDALFKRKAGDQVRLLMARRNEALPRFVQLAARRP